MNCIEGLPNSKGKETILVVVDRLTKYDHFVALSYPFTTSISYIAPLKLFCLIGTTFSLVNSDKNCSIDWVLAFTCPLPITLKLMGRQRSSIGVWKDTSDTWLVKGLMIGYCGFLYLNGGTILPTIQPFIPPHMRLCMARSLIIIYLTLLDHLLGYNG